MSKRQSTPRKAMQTATSKAGTASKADAVKNTVHVPTPAEITEMRARVDALRVRGAEYVLECSRVTYAVFTGGFIGKDRAYADQGAYADALGVSGSTVSGWLTLGRADALGIAGKDLDLVSANRGQGIGKAIGKAKTKTAAMKEVRAILAAKATKGATTRGPKQPASTPKETPAKPDALALVRDALKVLRAQQKSITEQADRDAIRGALEVLAHQYGAGKDTTTAQAS